uniref:Uncharacterized protein n=1 Tax=Haptolina brevifila TaxID=156173 RepID=A0A7S2HU36_9EUKA|mmetsp:Transcript_57740/g.114657  ORF Transcript_57740/g.114657 Transcript_57740/m.114657 type:complete len:271 (+) Transcript_57740:1254-2066(+)
MAVMRRVLTPATGAVGKGGGGEGGAEVSVAEALRGLLLEDLVNVPSWCRAQMNMRRFRDECCYIQDVDATFREWESSLRAIYRVYSGGDGAIGDEMHSNKLMDVAEWRTLLRDVQLMDESIRPKEATLIFVLSRMRVVDERPVTSKARLCQLTFEDFLEALVRMSTVKVLPTQEQVFDNGCDSAFDFILGMREGGGEEYAAFVRLSMQPWNAPLREPIYQMLECLCSMIMSTIEHELMRERQNETRKSNSRISDKEVALFRKQCQKRYGS